MNTQLVLFSTQNEDAPFVQEVAKFSKQGFEHVRDARVIFQMARENTIGGLFVDTRDFAPFYQILQAEVGLFSDFINPNKIHFISSDDLQDATAVLKSPVFGNYVSRNWGTPQEAAKKYSFIVNASLKDKSFGIQQYFEENQTRVQVVKFQTTSQKQEGVEAVKNFLIAVKFKSRMATVIANAVDELVMNAMFDAPTDDFGNPLFISTPRDTVMDLSGKRTVEMYIGFDGQYVAIMAVDLFGSLNKEKLMDHISKRYTEEAYKVKKTMAGAGIGLATVFRSGGSFCFTCDQGARTEVTVFFKRADNFRDFKEQFRFIATQFYFT